MRVEINLIYTPEEVIQWLKEYYEDNGIVPSMDCIRKQAIERFIADRNDYIEDDNIKVIWSGECGER